MTPEDKLYDQAVDFADTTKPVVVALFYDEDEHGEYDTEADRSVEEHLSHDFVHWDLHDCIDAGLPIDPDSGAELTLYGYYNRLSRTIHWL